MEQMKCEGLATEDKDCITWTHFHVREHFSDWKAEPLSSV